MAVNKSEDCQVCKYIRWYFMVGVPIVFFTWMQPELNIFKGLDLGNIFADCNYDRPYRRGRVEVL